MKRGYTLPELLVALLILAIVLTTTIAMFARRSQYLRESSETVLVWQAMWNEMEIWRRLDWSGLEAEPPKFQSDLAILAPFRRRKVAVSLNWGRTEVKHSNEVFRLFGYF